MVSVEVRVRGLVWSCAFVLPLSRLVPCALRLVLRVLSYVQTGPETTKQNQTRQACLLDTEENK
jgi:hypothetical protein